MLVIATPAVAALQTANLVSVRCSHLNNEPMRSNGRVRVMNAVIYWLGANERLHLDI